ncbi:MAG: hypothetical protein AAFW82_03340 [Pseudomonadota bacterium]
MQLSTFALRPATMPAFIAQIFLALSTAAFTTTASYADVVVQRAEKVPNLASGTKVSDDYVFDLPKGSGISLLKTPSGETFQMSGPFKGTLQTFVTNCNSWMWFRYEYCKSASGDPLPVGGTRGIQTEPQTQPQPQ